MKSVFEALGYAKNKEIMKALAKAVGIQFLQTIDRHDYVFTVESILINVAGLMPDINNLPDEEITFYVKKLYEHWNGIKNKYDGKMLNYSQWHFFRIWPQNFPTIRIAGGARIINKLVNCNLIDKMFEVVEDIGESKKLVQSLRSVLVVRGDGLWGKHYVFNQSKSEQDKLLHWRDRSDEYWLIFMLPVLYLYFEIFDKRIKSKSF